MRLNINGREVTGHKGQTILQIARENNIDIPTMCYDERLETYGACGLCVVEIKGSPKLARACATEAAAGMVIDTMSKKVVASRKAALELLMSDHVGDCKAPCLLACPGNTDCQGYVGLIASNQLDEAIKTIKDQLPMPACIGRVCPHPCETACRRALVEDPIAIAQLKYFAADNDLKSANPYMPEIAADSGKKIAVVGGGPGGLSIAYFLRQHGHDITVYDAMPKMGGMLRYGIPQYRLPKSVVDSEVAIFKKMGITMKNGIRMGKDISLDYLRKNNDAVIVATGAWQSSPLRCKGEELKGVVGGIEFLKENIINHSFNLGDKVAIVGGGNTAMDACRTAVRMGAKEVYNIYRRTKDEMPAEPIELIEAEEEGVIFKYLVSPIELIGENGKVKQMVLQKMQLGEEDASGRRRPVPIEGETEIIEVDCVITAIGQKLDAAGHDDISLTKWGTIASDPHTFMTNLEGVFAIGDATNDGADIAIAAIGEAKKASNVIHTYMTSKIEPYYAPFYSVKKNVTAADYAHMEKASRSVMPHLKPEARRDNFEEVNLGFSLEQAMKEGARCLECGCLDVYDCDLIKYSNEYDISPEKFDGEMHHRSIDNPHPFIQIDQDKCILCGQCVRTCEEVLGIGALGLVDRGFDSMMQPAFNLPLIETGCISCGQCVSVCPTGALQERLTMPKLIPLPPERTHSVCDKCSMGCNVTINTKRDNVIRVESIRDSHVDDGQLCVRGRFGHTPTDVKKIISPMVKVNGELVTTTWQHALEVVANRLRGHILGNTANKVGFALSARYTNEDLYSAKLFGKNDLKAGYVSSLNTKDSALYKPFGVNGSTNTYEELLSTDVILTVGIDLMKDYPVLGMKLRKAIKNGTVLLCIDTEQTMQMAWATDQKVIENSYGAFGQTLEDKVFIERFTMAKNAMIVYEGSILSDDVVISLGQFAKKTGHVGKPRNGLIEMVQGANTQGLRDLGLACQDDLFKQAIQNGNIETLLLFGENEASLNTSAVAFTVVQDVYLTAQVQNADVVLPAQTFEQMSGTFTSAERQIQSLHAATKKSEILSVTALVDRLKTLLEIVYDAQSVEQITHQIGRNIVGYSALLGDEKTSFTHNNQRVLDFIEKDEIVVDKNTPFKVEITKSNQVRVVLDNYLAKENII